MSVFVCQIFGWFLFRFFFVLHTRAFVLMSYDVNFESDRNFICIAIFDEFCFLVFGAADEGGAWSVGAKQLQPIEFFLWDLIIYIYWVTKRAKLTYADKYLNFEECYFWHMFCLFVRRPGGNFCADVGRRRRKCQNSWYKRVGDVLNSQYHNGRTQSAYAKPMRCT